MAEQEEVPEAPQEAQPEPPQEAQPEPPQEEEPEAPPAEEPEAPQEDEPEAPQEEEPEIELLVIGDTLNKMRDELNDKFQHLAENMEYQLADLRRQLKEEKELTSQLRAQCEEFKQEAAEKTQDLHQINGFYAANDDASSFEALLNDVIERHQVFSTNLREANYNGNVAPMNKEWQDEIYKLIQTLNASGDDSEKAAVIDELQQRTKELDAIKRIMNGEEPASKMEELADLCEERHAAQQGDAMSTYSAPGKVSDDAAVRDNGEWEELLREFVKNPPKGGDDMDTRNELFQQELEGRIGDLQTVKDILQKKNDDEVEAEQIQEAARDLLSAVHHRHSDIEDKVQSTANGNNGDDVAKVEAFKNNDTEWRRELGDLVGKVQEEPEEEADRWWLDLDDGRRAHYDNILVDQHENDTLMLGAVYLNRELGADDEKSQGDHTALYIPMEPINKHRVIGTLFDAAELCDFVAAVNPSMLDTRCVHRPSSLEEPYPLPDRAVWENASLLLSSCKAMALQLPTYDPAAWVDAELRGEHAPLLIAVLDQLCKERLKNFVNIEKHPEIIRLLTGSELADDPEKVRNFLLPTEVLKRWMNMTLGRPTNADVGSIAVDLYKTLCKLDPEGLGGAEAPQIHSNVMNKAAAEAMLDYVGNTMGIPHHLEVDDLLAGNEKLEELLAARVFDLNNGLTALSEDEETKYRAFWVDENHDDDSYLPWLNSQLPPHLRIGNLYRDLSDGIILAHILERCQRDVIDWKKMRKQIRHKFDKVTNCNHVYDTMKNKFPFSLVGIGGNDIVDGRQMYIHTILWQIMRYQATKKLSELSFGGKEVKDADILKWSKDTHQALEDRKSATAKSFKDRVLTTAVFYLELLKAMGHAEDVKDELVHWDIKPAGNQQEVEQDLDRRLANARYTISLIRMFGGDIFVLPEDLVAMEPKAVMSVYAALMTIAYEGKSQPAGKGQEMNKMEDALYGSGGLSG